ncbi:hypothetical protein JKP88DRAFT_267909 [Tribonema minus]|uniref:DOMON domain-containing protein n=1 Tax=Tribonema minus TaxID=303371 RepID=A0A835Z913_9STRA|nr:hypothetical protein JKP88DRAFT_267909 [Tribonema minus]
MPGARGLFAALAAAWLLQASNGAPLEAFTCTPSDVPDFACSAVLDDGVTFSWSIDEVLGTLSGRLDVILDEPEWIGWGRSLQGKMKGSDAVVCQPLDTGITIARYELNSYSTSAVLPSPVQDLTDAACAYAAATKTMTMTFTRPLAATSPKHIAILPDITQPIVYAYGATKDLMRHKSRSGAMLMFAAGAAAPADPPAATVRPRVPPAAGDPVNAPDAPTPAPTPAPLEGGAATTAPAASAWALLLCVLAYFA